MVYSREHQPKTFRSKETNGAKNIDNGNGRLSTPDFNGTWDNVKDHNWMRQSVPMDQVFQPMWGFPHGNEGPTPNQHLLRFPDEVSSSYQTMHQYSQNQQTQAFDVASAFGGLRLPHYGAAPPTQHSKQQDPIINAVHALSQSVKTLQELTQRDQTKTFLSPASTYAIRRLLQDIHGPLSCLMVMPEFQSHMPTHSHKGYFHEVGLVPPAVANVVISPLKTQEEDFGTGPGDEDMNESRQGMKAALDGGNANLEATRCHGNSEQRQYQRDFDTLKARCERDELNMTFHLKPHGQGTPLESEIISATADQLEESSAQMADKLRQTLRTKESVYLQSDSIMVVQFKNNAECRAVKEAMTKHVREMYARGDMTLYKYVQGFVISCPEQIRRVKRTLKDTAAEIKRITGHKMPLYIGTPILDGCEKRFTPFAQNIKDELIWKAVYTNKEGESLKSRTKDVVYCETANAIQGTITWLTTEEAVEHILKQQREENTG